MKTNEKILTFNDIHSDLEKISKKLYLESPEIWIDFSDKVGEQKIDEMVLFYASKFNYLSILKYATDNNIMDLNIPSKNKNYLSIKEHLLATSKDYKSYDVYNYLSGDYKLCEDNTEIDTNKSLQIKEEKHHKNYFPIFLCPHCNTNIFKSGYKVYEEISFAFSKDKSKSQELNRKRDNKVFCNNCNSNIDNVTTELLENICSIHNCGKCEKDLTEIGIIEKTRMKFKEEDSKFICNEKTYNCPSCDKVLNESQRKYFNL